MPRRPIAPKVRATDEPQKIVRASEPNTSKSTTPKSTPPKSTPSKSTTSKSTTSKSPVQKPAAQAPSVPFPSERNDQLVKLGDLCAAAQRIAEAQGEKLLVYLLAMAIQEGQTALRREIAAQAGVSDGSGRTPH